MNAEEDALEALELGELAGITPQDEFDPVNNNYDVRFVYSMCLTLK